MPISHLALQQNKKCVIGTLKGYIIIVDSQTGEIVNSVQPHSHEVCMVEIDYQHQLIVSISSDCSILVWQEVNAHPSSYERSFRYKKLRQVLGCNEGNEIKQAYVSYSTSVILTTSLKSLIYVFNYEFGTYIGLLDFSPHHVVSVSGYDLKGLFFVLTSNHSLSIIKLTIDHDRLFYHPLGQIQLNSLIHPCTAYLIENVASELLIFLATSNGQLAQALLNINSPHITPAFKRNNFNALRQSKEDLTNLQKKIREYQVADLDNLPLNLRQVVQVNQSHINHLSLFYPETLMNIKNNKAFLVVCSYNGMMNMFNASDFMLIGKFNITHPLPLVWNVGVRMFYLNQQPKIQEKLKFGLKVVQQLKKKYEEQMSLKVKGCLEIENLLNFFLKKQLMLEFLKNAMLNQEARLHPQLFLTNFSQSKNMRQSLSTRKRQAQVYHSQKQKASSMKDEYTSFDLHASMNKDLIKPGPCLKKLDQFKKQYDLQQQIKRDLENERLKEIQLKNKKKKRDANNLSGEENKETKQIMNYLSEDYFKKLLNGETRKHFHDQPQTQTELYLAGLKRKMNQISKSQNSDNSPRLNTNDRSQKTKPITLQKVEEPQKSTQSVIQTTLSLPQSPRRRRLDSKIKDPVEQKYALRSRYSSYHQNNNDPFYSTFTAFNTTRETFNSKVMMDTLKDKNINFQFLQEQVSQSLAYVSKQSKKVTTAAHKSRKVQFQQFSNVVSQMNAKLLQTKTFKQPIIESKSKSHTNLLKERVHKEKKSEILQQIVTTEKSIPNFKQKEKEIDNLVEKIQSQILRKMQQQ